MDVRRGRASSGGDEPEQDRNNEEDDAQNDRKTEDHSLRSAALHNNCAATPERGGETGSAMLHKNAETQEQADDHFDAGEYHGQGHAPAW